MEIFLHNQASIEDFERYIKSIRYPKDSLYVTIGLELLYGTTEVTTKYFKINLVDKLTKTVRVKDNAYDRFVDAMINKLSLSPYRQHNIPITVRNRENDNYYDIINLRILPRVGKDNFNNICAEAISLIVNTVMNWVDLEDGYDERFYDRTCFKDDVVKGNCLNNVDMDKFRKDVARIFKEDDPCITTVSPINRTNALITENIRYRSIHVRNDGNDEYITTAIVYSNVTNKFLQVDFYYTSDCRIVLKSNEEGDLRYLIKSLIDKDYTDLQGLFISLNNLDYVNSYVTFTTGYEIAVNEVIGELARLANIMQEINGIDVSKDLNIVDLSSDKEEILRVADSLNGRCSIKFYLEDSSKNELARTGFELDKNNYKFTDKFAGGRIKTFAKSIPLNEDFYKDNSCRVLVTVEGTVKVNYKLFDRDIRDVQFANRVVAGLRRIHVDFVKRQYFDLYKE